MNVGGLLLALMLSVPAAGAAPSEGSPRELDAFRAGFGLIGLWGLEVRAGLHGHRGPLDFVGLRGGFVAGPSPVFALERTLAATWLGAVVDLFPQEAWQLELTLGGGALDHDDHGHGLFAWDSPGAVAGVAARYETDGPFQINLGLLGMADAGFEERVLTLAIGPGWVW